MYRSLQIYLISGLCLITPPLLAQTGSMMGKVFDKATSTALPAAHVFVNNTTLGTVTDEKGNYNLENLTEGTNEIIVFLVGYKALKAKIQIKQGQATQADIRLLPEERHLETVGVVAKPDKEWEDLVDRFKQDFLGKTQFANSCTIINPWVLNFSNEIKDGVVYRVAMGSAPLEIENMALGYKVIFYSKRFKSSDNFTIPDEVHFEELIAKDPTQDSVWKHNRTLAYNGSYRHLFKAIVDGRTKAEGFSFIGDVEKTIQSESHGEGYKMEMIPHAEVRYQQPHLTNAADRVSWLDIRGGILIVNKDGILENPNNLILSGVMSEARVANLLPYNYQEQQESTQNVFALLQRKMLRLQEKPYLHTDKSYYYPGEKIWFKAYMNYRTPEVIDSLSRVLYVELIGPDKTIHQTKTVLIDGGSGVGSMDLPNDIIADDYSIRAYTTWMLNYDHTNLFTKAIPVLGLREWPDVRATDVVEQKITKGLTLHTDPTPYQVQKPITLGIELRDEKGIPLAADLSVSVTDINQAVEVPGGKTILSDFSISSKPGNQQLENGKLFPIEYGINLRGQYTNRKGKPVKSSFILVVDSLKVIRSFETDSSGNFSVNGLRFYDSVNVGFQLAEKNIKPGKITMHRREIPSTEKSNVKPLFNRVTIPSSQKAVSAPIKLAKDTRLLDEVVIEAKPILNKDIIPNAFGKSDFAITGDELLKFSMTSLLDALRGRIGFGMGLGRGGPLLILDGVQISPNDIYDTRVFDILSQISIVTVERVDYMKYANAAAYGSRGGGGVLVVTLKKGSYGTVNNSITYTSKNFQQIIASGFSHSASFRAPDYSTDSRQINDKRTTIYWNPMVTTDLLGWASFSFYSADTPSVYKIEVEGVSAGGNPVRGVFYIDIAD